MTDERVRMMRPIVIAMVLLAGCGASSTDVPLADTTTITPDLSGPAPLPLAEVTVPSTTVPPSTAAPVTAAPTTTRPPATAPPATQAPVAAPAPVATAAPSAYYANCSAARAAGAAPVYRVEPGYASHLDRDGDGVGCE